MPARRAPLPGQPVLVSPLEALSQESTRDLADRYNSRNYYDALVIGSLLLAFRRGYQSGAEDHAAGKCDARGLSRKGRRRRILV